MNRYDPKSRTRPTVVESVRATPRLFLVPVALLLVFAGIVGAFYSPTYSAEATLSVQQTPIGPQGLVGFGDTSAALATSYSSAIDSPYVTNRLARETDLSVDEIRSNLSAVATPDSGIVRITAEAETPAAAIDLANSASRALTGYVEQVNRGDGPASRLLRTYESASRRFLRLESTLSSGAGGDSDEIARLEARRETAKLQADAARTAYERLEQGRAAAVTLSQVSPATDTTDDRFSTLQRLFIVSLLAGVLLGAALVTLVATRRDSGLR